MIEMLSACRIKESYVAQTVKDSDFEIGLSKTSVHKGLLPEQKVSFNVFW
jgi:hypothetical protein